MDVTALQTGNSVRRGPLIPIYNYTFDFIVEDNPGVSSRFVGFVVDYVVIESDQHI